LNTNLTKLQFILSMTCSLHNSAQYALINLHPFMS